MDISLLEFSNLPIQIPYGEDKNAMKMTFGVKSYMVHGFFEANSTDCHVLVGSYSSLAHRLIFTIASNHDYKCITTYPQHKIAPLDDPAVEQHSMNPISDPVNYHQIVIGHDVWIGSDALLVGGVHIGNGAVIGARTFVTKDVPPYAIAVGNPMRIVKYRFDPETITRLQRIKWWNWSVDEVAERIPKFNRDMAAFLDAFDPGDVERSPDEAAKSIRELHESGYHVSYFIPDFDIDVNTAVWPRVIDRYLAAYTAEDRAALVLAVPAGAQYQPYLDVIHDRLARNGAQTPLVLSHPCAEGMPLSIAALQESDAYITTREPVCSYAVDYAADGGCDIRYGLDYGALLFPPLM